MNKVKFKKLASVFAVATLSASAICGVAFGAGCKKKDVYDGSNDPNDGTGTIYYVSVDGSKDNDGSKKSPKDLVSLLNATSTSDTYLKPGDTVLVQPGTYKLATINPVERITMQVSGKHNNYITIKNADPSKQCVLDFSAQEFNSANRGVSLYGNYIYWQGIDVCGAGDNGLYIGGNFNTVENCEFYNNRDTGLQLGRSYAEYTTIDQWPSYNLIKNCTSHNNYDNETYGENADGFAAKLTVGYGNVFDGCIAYRNSDDGWDLYAKTDSGNIGAVIMYNCVAYENGFIEYTQEENNARFPTWNGTYNEDNTNSYLTRDGDGNGFKLGGSVMEGDVVLKNCLAFNNRMHGVTDNSNPGVISVEGVTSYNNSAMVDDRADSNTFGYVIDISNFDEHANIDLSRQIYSYNNLKRILSMKDELAKSLSADAYRGSVVDSILLTKKIDGSIDADTKNDDGAMGDSFKAPASSEIFTTLPFTRNGSEYNFNITGLNDLYKEGVDGELNPNRAHKKYRNSDNSINMGDILDVKNYSLLLGEDKKIGSKLNLGSYGEYKHFFAKEFTDLKEASEDKAVIARISEALTLNCDPDSVYQDFDVPTMMTTYQDHVATQRTTCSITWESSDTSLLKIDNDDKQISSSQSEYVMAVVYRPLTEDKKVTLTATLTCGEVSLKKDFELTIKAGQPTIGGIFVQTMNGEDVPEGGTLIVDQYQVYTEPEVFVKNGIDYHGKLLSEDLYDVTTKYMFTSDKSLASVPVAGFTPSNAGVYTITKTVTLKRDPSQYKSMSYTVYVASPYADVDFMTSNITVNRHGYLVSGEMTNATGKLYAISSATPLNLTEDNKASLLTLEGVEEYTFRGDNISFQFKNDNAEAYHIYYLVTNLEGKITSQLYEKSVSVQAISTKEDLNTIASGSTINGEEPATTIYELTSDLDLTGAKWDVGKESFRGLLNGKGHTIRNMSVKGVGMFYKVDGGTIMNVKFDNIDIKSDSTKTALVSECTGGYFYNIQITNINVLTSNQRAAGLIGHVNVGTPLVIEQVSINNTKEDYKIKASQRVGGLIAFSQAGSSYSSGAIDITISNCWVNAAIEGAYELGGIYGNYDCGNNTNCTYNLKIAHCVFTGTVTATGSKTFAAGILGYHKGAYAAMEITNCISVGKIYFAGVEVVTSLKNCSGIVGSTSTLVEGLNAKVSNCYARMEEFNSDYDVTVWDRYAVLSADNYLKRAGLDSEKWSLVYDNDSTTVVKAPYVNLNFLGEWE